MPDPLAAISTRHTPQSEPATTTQVQNAAGGYTFEVSDDTRLLRFLTLGTDGGTYYTSEHQVTKENAAVVLDWARNRSSDLVNRVVAVSVAGRAPRNNQALFALAAAVSLGDAEGRALAVNALPRVARTGTHLFQFVSYVEQFRGWGRGLRRAVGRWYLEPPVEHVAYQAAKYRERNGWTHRDLLRLAHPAAVDPSRKALFDWICRRDADLAYLPIISAFQKAQAATSEEAVVGLVNSGVGLSWEMLPDLALTSANVWRALIEQGLPQTALMRQLPRLTRLGVLAPMSTHGKLVADQLADPARLTKARVHPVNVLVAGRTYSSGQSARGSGEWTPVAKIVDALDAAFYAAFGAIEPANRRTMLALDVSGSMGWSQTGLPITCREASAAMSLVTAATEPQTVTVGFTGGRGPNALTELSISPRQRLDDAIRAISDLPFGSTDCALPMIEAQRRRWEIDTFVVYTDNETWAGAVHPHEALVEYRQKMGINARLIVVGMSATECSIADPDDRGMLDVAGFDSTVPSLIGDFSARRL